MPLNYAYCNALVLAYWSVRQKLNHISSVQLRPSLRALEYNFVETWTRNKDPVLLRYETHLDVSTGEVSALAGITRQ